LPAAPIEAREQLYFPSSTPSLWLATHHQGDENRARHKHQRGPRTLNEDHSAVGRHRQRLPQRLLEQWGEDEGDNERREIILELRQHITGHAEPEHDPQVEHVLVGGIDADDRKQQHDRKQHAIRDAQKLHPQPDQRQVQQQQQHISHVHAGDDAPEQIGPLSDEQRTRLDAVNDQGAEQQCRHRVAWNAERKHGDDAARDGGVIGRFRARDAFDGAFAKAVGMCGYPLFQGIGHERRGHRPAPGDQTQEESQSAAAKHGPPRGPQSANVGHKPRMRSAMRVLLTTRSTLFNTSVTPNSPMTTARSSMPAERSTDPKVKRSRPLTTSMPTAAVRNPSATISAPFTGEPVIMKRVQTMPRPIRAKFSGGPKRMATVAIVGAKNVITITPSVPATKEPIAAIPRAAPARPCFAIWWPSRQVTTDAASPGMFRRIEVVEPPYMAP